MESWLMEKAKEPEKFCRLQLEYRISFFGVLGKGMGSLFREFVIGADSFGQLSSGIPNRILSGLMYWLIVAIVMGILFNIGFSMFR